VNVSTTDLKIVDTADEDPKTCRDGRPGCKRVAFIDGRCIGCHAARPERRAS
jgi:hypothetical protein